jgi:hypothetical protein
MNVSRARAYLRRKLEEHLTKLGYSSARNGDAGSDPQIARVNPVCGRIAYGETVQHGDLRRQRCHERLIAFSKRRTRHRGTILLFLGVAEADRQELEALLVRLEIRNGVRGGHVHVVPIPLPAETRRRTDSRKQRA